MSTSISTDTSAGALRALRAEVERLRRRNAALERLVELIVDADIWDETVYDCRPGDDWLLVHRESWAGIRGVVDGVDAWRPWDGKRGESQ
ncbi:hypothetical protein ACFQ07_26235 [Actinomadura adrarensis]|uniref:Uncharacterized protein n=1 Tax=Actinomadura adrarensis TaxID=1819600 RepID=A0ABW3CQ40_9ACTN